MSVLAVAAASAVMAGAALQSAIGFGFALVAAPLLYAAAPSPEQAVGLMIVLGLEVNLLTLLAERRRPAPVWRDVVAVVPGRCRARSPAWPCSARSTTLALQLLVTAGVLVALVLNLQGEPSASRTVPAGPVAGWARPAAGLASGALNTSTSTGGPPVASAADGARAAAAGDPRHADDVVRRLRRRLHRRARPDGDRGRGPGRGVARRARAAHRGRAARRTAAVQPDRRGPLVRARARRSCCS